MKKDMLNKIFSIIALFAVLAAPAMRADDNNETSDYKPAANPESDGYDFEYKGIKYQWVDKEAKTVQTAGNYKLHGSLRDDNFTQWDESMSYNGVSQNLTFQVYVDGTNESDGYIYSSGLNYGYSDSVNPKTLSLPAKVICDTDGNEATVVGIGAYSFSDNYGNCDIEEITIPNTIEYIEEGAFCSVNGKVTKLVFEDGSQLKSIGNYAFYKVQELETLIIPDCVETIGVGAFSNFGMNKSNCTLTLGKGLKTIGDYAFYYCKNLKALTIPDNVTQIGNFAFVYFAESEGCTLTLGKGIETIGDYAFFYCQGLSELIIPDNVKEIGDLAFFHCNNLKSTNVQFGESIETIGRGAFVWGEFLVDLPASVKKIGKDAFKLNDKESILHDFYCNALTPPALDKDGWGEYDEENINEEHWIYAKVCLHVPQGMGDIYRSPYLIYTKEGDNVKVEIAENPNPGTPNNGTPNNNESTDSENVESMEKIATYSDDATAEDSYYGIPYGEAVFNTWSQFNCIIDDLVDTEEVSLGEIVEYVFIEPGDELNVIDLVNERYREKERLDESYMLIKEDATVEVNLAPYSTRNTTPQLITRAEWTMELYKAPDKTDNPRETVMFNNLYRDLYKSERAKRAQDGEEDDSNVDYKYLKEENDNGQTLEDLDYGYLKGKDFGQVLVLVRKNDKSVVYKDTGSPAIEAEHTTVACVVVFVCPRITVVYNDEQVKKTVAQPDEESTSPTRAPQFRTLGSGDTNIEDFTKEYASYDYRVVYNSLPKVVVDTPTADVEIEVMRGDADKDGLLTSVEGVDNDVTPIETMAADGAIVPADPIDNNRVLYAVVSAAGTVGVKEVEIDNGITVVTDGRVIEIRGAAEDSEVTIVNLNGVVIYRGTQKVIPVPAQGVYIATVENSAFKLSVK